jgi:transcriptional regulator MraZ
MLDPPRGAYSAHLDDKGRLKMPVNFKEYIESLEDSRLFVTTTDQRIAKLYPILVWKENEIKLKALALENPPLAKALSQVARHYGEDAKIDAGGRVLIPTNLRRLLAIEGQEIWMEATPEGCINVYSTAEYNAQLEKSKALLEQANEAAERKGFV